MPALMESRKDFILPGNANYNWARFAAYIATVYVWLKSRFIIVVFLWRLAMTAGRERDHESQKAIEREGGRENENEMKRKSIASTITNLIVDCAE